MTDAEKLRAIEQLCRRSANAARNPGAHALAVEVLAIADPAGWAAALVAQRVAQSEPDRLEI